MSEPFTPEAIAQSRRNAYQEGRDSLADRDAECPYDPESDLAEEWENGRNDAEVEAGEEFADYCDPSMRDLYE
jgi:hypothetical protein